MLLRKFVKALLFQKVKHAIKKDGVRLKRMIAALKNPNHFPDLKIPRNSAIHLIKKDCSLE